MGGRVDLILGDLDNGRYEPREEIGRGAMGVVYLAWDRRLEKLVAIKVLHSGAVTDERARDTFRQEANILGLLDQTRIARIQDSFQQDGRDVIVMEYVPGESLDERLKKGPLPEREVVRFGVQLAEGLTAAHKKGVLHRDLKPSNLRVNEDGDLKILDFGVAKLWKQDPNPPETQAPVLQRSGNTIHDASGFVGTYPYFSPEQLRGRDVDPRADLYAAGAVLYEMATGKQIFADAPVERLAEAIEKDKPVRPRRLRRGISRSLERVIHRALEKQSGRRFEDAHAMRQALLWTRWRRWSGWASAATAALALATAFGLDAGRVRSRIFPVARPGSVQVLAVLPFENATGDAALDDWCAGLGREFIQATTRAFDVAVLAPRTSLRLRGLSPRAIGRERGAQAVLTGRVERRDSTLRVDVTLLDPTAWRPLWRSQRETRPAEILVLARTLLEESGRTLALRPRKGMQGVLDSLQAVDPRALEAYFRGCASLEAEDADGCARAVEFLERAVAIDSTFAPAWAALARATYGVPTDALPLEDAIERAERAAWRALAANADLPEPYIVLGCVKDFNRGDPDGGKQELERALVLDPNHALAHRVLGVMHLHNARFEEAVLELQLAWRLDPLNEPVHDDLWQFFARAEYDSVIAAGQRVLNARPEDWEVYLLMGRSAALKGDSQLAESPVDYLEESAHQRLRFFIPKSVIAGVHVRGDAAAASLVLRTDPGTVYIADISALDGRGAVLGLDPETGAQWVVAAGDPLQGASDVAVDSDGSLLVVWESSRKVVRVDPRTGKQTLVSAAQQFVEPCGVAVSQVGEIYVADWNLWPPGFVYQIDRTTGVQTTIASGKSLENPLHVACLPDGDLAVAANTSTTGRGCVYRVKLGGEYSVLASGGLLFQPFGVQVGPDGALYVGDYAAFGGGGGVIRIDSRTGAQSIVSSGGDFVDPVGLAFMSSGDLLVADWNQSSPLGQVIRIDPKSGEQTRVYKGGLMVRPTSIAIAPGATITSPQRNLVVEGPMKLPGGRFASVRIQAGVLTVTGRLEVSGDLRIAHEAGLVCDGVVATGGDVIVESGGKITHGTRSTDGLLLQVGGTLEIQKDACIDASGRGLRGGSAASNFFGETFDSEGRPAWGVSGGEKGGPGASHGGEGGRDTAGGVSNSTYGSATVPQLLGSGAGGARGGAGGGRITIRARRCNVDGAIRANGNDGWVYRREMGGGGSGGSILIIAKELAGAGHIEVHGGSGSHSYGWGGGGGGGRIAIYSDRNSLASEHLSAAGGESLIPGQPGTITSASFRRGPIGLRAASNSEAALDRR